MCHYCEPVCVIKPSDQKVGVPFSFTSNTVLVKYAKHWWKYQCAYSWDQWCSKQHVLLIFSLSFTLCSDRPRKRILWQLARFWVCHELETWGLVLPGFSGICRLAKMQSHFLFCYVSGSLHPCSKKLFLGLCSDASSLYYGQAAQQMLFCSS